MENLKHNQCAVTNPATGRTKSDQTPFHKVRITRILSKIAIIFAFCGYARAAGPGTAIQTCFDGIKTRFFGAKSKAANCVFGLTSKAPDCSSCSGKIFSSCSGQVSCTPMLSKLSSGMVPVNEIRANLGRPHLVAPNRGFIGGGLGLTAIGGYGAHLVLGHLGLMAAAATAPISVPVAMVGGVLGIAAGATFAHVGRRIKLDRLAVTQNQPTGSSNSSTTSSSVTSPLHLWATKLGNSVIIHPSSNAQEDLPESGSPTTLTPVPVSFKPYEPAVRLTTRILPIEPKVEGENNRPDTSEQTPGDEVRAPEGQHDANEVPEALVSGDVSSRVVAPTVEETNPQASSRVVAPTQASSRVVAPTVQETNPQASNSGATAAVQTQPTLTSTPVRNNLVDPTATTMPMRGRRYSSKTTKRRASTRSGLRNSPKRGRQLRSRRVSPSTGRQLWQSRRPA